MEQKPDYYQILGVLPNSEDVVIRGAYRALMQKYHPDMAGGAADEAAQRTREINEAYAVLRDPEARARYDAGRLAATPEPITAVYASAPATPPQPPAAEQTPVYPPPGDLASLIYRGRHALITAGYLAAVLLIFVVARAAFTNRHPSAATPKASEEIALSDSRPSQHTASVNPSPARSPAPETRATKPQAFAPDAKEKAAPVPQQSPKPAASTAAPSSQVAKATSPAPNHDTAVSAHPVSPPSTAPDRSHGPLATQHAAPAQSPPPVRNVATKSVEPTARSASNHRYAASRHRPRRTVYASRQSYDETHSAAREEADEATTKWLNDRSAISRPRWRPYKTWLRPRSQY